MNEEPIDQMSPVLAAAIQHVMEVKGCTQEQAAKAVLAAMTELDLVETGDEESTRLAFEDIVANMDGEVS